MPICVLKGRKGILCDLLLHRHKTGHRGGRQESGVRYSRELALAISLVSLGSNQTFFLPQRRTLEASLF